MGRLSLGPFSGQADHLSGDRRVKVCPRAEFPCPKHSRLGSFGERVRRYILPWVRFAAGRELGSFRQAVTSCRGFVSRDAFGSFGELVGRYILPWVRFVETLQLAVGSFRRRFGSFGEVVGRYILPWVRFVESLRVRSGKSWAVTDCRGFVSSTTLGFVRGSRGGVTACRGFVSQRLAELGSFRRGVTDCRGFVSSRRFGSFGEVVGRYKLPWVRFVETLGFVRGSRGRYILPWVRFAAALELGSFRRAVTSCRGFVSSRRFGLFGEVVGRHILPWVRFVETLRLVRGSRGPSYLAVGSFRRDASRVAAPRHGISAVMSNSQDRRRGAVRVLRPYHRNHVATGSANRRTSAGIRRPSLSSCSP